MTKLISSFTLTPIAKEQLKWLAKSKSMSCSEWIEQAIRKAYKDA
jgi:hypothetical protein